MKIKVLPLVWSAVTISWLFSARQVHADSLTVGVDDLENCFPFSCFVHTGNNDYQQVYNSGAFPNTAMNIESFDVFKSVDGTLDTATFDVHFSTSMHPVGDLSPVFSENIGLDQQFFGSFSLAGPIQPITSFLAADAFVYNPSHGDLLMTVALTSGVADGAFSAFFQADNTGSGVFQRAYGTGPSAKKIDNWGLVTRFHYSPVPGPLPLMGAAAVFRFSRALRKRRTTPGADGRSMS